MVFNSAVSFVLVALALAAPQLAPVHGRRLRSALGGALFLFAAAIFSQYLTGADLGLDGASLHTSAAAMKPQISIGKGTLRITTSAGLAFYQGEAAPDSEALLRRADEALYAAKAAGRNNIKVAA